MYNKCIALFLYLSLFATNAIAADLANLEEYVSSFSYDSRQEMKASSKELIQWIKEEKAIVVDIRFPEETAVWSLGFGLKIPLNELPKRLSELPKDKIIVTACPHNDRSNIARIYLITKGFNAKYLTDGLLGLEAELRGDKAQQFFKATHK